MQDISKKEKLILDLHTVKAIKFGQFKLKSGIISPYYLDLRVLVSYPYLLQATSEVFWEIMRLLEFDLIVGVPYTAIPISTAISLQHNQTMVFIRKERKKYGTKKLIEGVFHSGQKAVVIDDVITDGASKFETIEPLTSAGLIVQDIIILLDRGQSGPEKLRKRGYNCHAIFSMDEVLNILEKHKRETEKTIKKSRVFMKKNS